MPNGLIHQNDEKEVLDFAQEVKKVFAVNLAEKATVEASNTKGNNLDFKAANVIDNDKNTYWATDDQVKSASLVVSFDKPTAFNRFLVQEYIKLGQRVKSFKLEAYVNEQWKELASETTIGYKRILCFPTVEASKLRFTILDTKKGALISNIGIYNAPQILTAPQIIRKQSGVVSIIPSDVESEIYYTLDGSTPTFKSKKYTNEVPTTDSKVEVKAIAYNPITGKSSAVAEEKFDIARKNWKIINSNETEAYNSIDGNPNSVWHLKTAMPADVVMDLGKIENLVGFRYLPDQDLRSKGIVTKYQFYVSLDNKKWELVNEGEFSNITNNPLWQNKIFKLAKARYIKFTALENTKGDNVAGFAEIDVMTK
jgi:alpha-L-fucosidase